MVRFHIFKLGRKYKSCWGNTREKHGMKSGGNRSLSVMGSNLLFLSRHVTVSPVTFVKRRLSWLIRGVLLCGGSGQRRDWTLARAQAFSKRLGPSARSGSCPAQRATYPHFHAKQTSYTLNIGKCIRLSNCLLTRGLWPWVGEACLQPRPHPRARGPPSGGFLCLPHSPQGQRADFRSGGQRADLHRSALEGGGREARVEAIVCMWLELREGKQPTHSWGVFYIQHGGCIISHPNWDTLESEEKGQAWSHQEGRHKPGWSWWTGTCGSLYR